MKRAHDLSLTQVNNYLASYIECLNVKIKNNEMKKKVLHIEGMSCAHCSARVEKALNSLEGVEAKVNLAEKKADVTFNGELSDEVLKKAVEDAGYEVIDVK